MSDSTAAALERLRARRVVLPKPEGPARASAYVCEAVSCLSTQSHEVLIGLGEQVSDAGFTDVAVKRVGCLGMCAAGPLVQISETGQLFSHVRPDDLGRIVEALAGVSPGEARVEEAPLRIEQLLALLLVGAIVDGEIELRHLLVELGEALVAADGALGRRIRRAAIVARGIGWRSETRDGEGDGKDCGND